MEICVFFILVERLYSTKNNLKSHIFQNGYNIFKMHVLLVSIVTVKLLLFIKLEDGCSK